MTKNTDFLPRQVVFLVADDLQPIDLAGPMQAFVSANDITGRAAYEVRTVGHTAGPRQLHGGLTVLAEAPSAEPIDTLLVPGGPGVHPARKDPALMAVVRALAARSRRICSICSGAFVLAEAGLLDGHRAATHWNRADWLAREFPRVEVDPEPIWINSGRIWTSAGMTAGIDLAMALIEADLGNTVARAVARTMVVYMRRPGGQTQYSAPLELQDADAFGPLLDWAAANLEQPLRAEDLAARAAMTPRSFHRHFLARTGVTPAKAIQRLRLQAACALLETTRLPLVTIARQTGFGAEGRLQTAFQRRFGLPPGEWRRRFSGTEAA